MTKNKMKFGALLAVMLIVGMAFVPAVSAQVASPVPLVKDVTQASCGTGTCPTCGFGNASNISKLDKSEECILIAST